MFERQVVGYIRVSTEEQAKSGLSLENQSNKIRAYAEMKDLKLSKILKDAARSAKNLNRPEVQEIIEGIKAKKIGQVVIYKLDRLTRSVGDLAFLLTLFEKYDVTFSSVVETLDTSSASGKLVIHMIGMIAEWERATIAERTQAALDVKRSRGERLGGIVPYGFRAVAGMLVPDPVEFDIRKRILESRGDGYGYQEMADQMNKTNIHPRSGKQWYASTVRSICLRATASDPRSTSPPTSSGRTRPHGAPAGSRRRGR